MKTLKFLLIVAISTIALTSSAYGQPPAYSPGSNSSAASKPGFGKFSGTIIDENQQPVPYATISLTNSTTDKLVDGTIADGDGKWTIKNVSEGLYKITISFIGYESITKGPFEITGKGNSITLDDVQLETSTTELAEVVISGERDLIEDKVDRIIYNADQDLTTAGGDASDVLRRVPLLSVDLEGNVSLRGSSNITILIDGKPSTITAGSIADALKQIPADEIKSVEVITSPSARYDAEGTGGIINIITKKNNLQGATLAANTGVGYRGSNLGLNAGYRAGNLGLTLGGNGFSGYNILGSFENQQQVFDANGDLLSTTYQSAETVSSRVNGRFNFGWDYTLNKYNFFGGGVNYRIFDARNRQDDFSTQIISNNSTEVFLQDVSTLTNSNSIDVNFNYIRSFEEKGKEISLITLYSVDRRANDFEIEQLTRNTSNLKNENISTNKEFTIQLDYVEPLGEKAKFETGVKNISRIVNSDFQLFQSSAGGEFTEVGDPSTSNELEYTQNVSAIYALGLIEIPFSFTLQAGGRYEYTSISANFANDVALDIPDYGAFTPSLNLSKSLKNSGTLKFGYSRRITRPGLQFLNPNRNSSNQINVSQGNPNLEPEFTHQVELSYSNFKQALSYNISVFARTVDGSIQAVRETIGDDIIYTTFQNIGEEDAYGINVFGNIRQGKLTLNGGFDTYYAILRNNIEDPLYSATNKGFVFNARLFGSYKLSEKWALQMFGFYRSPRIQLQGFTNGFYIYSLSINRMFKDNRGSIGLGANNFATPSNKLNSEITSPLLVQENSRELQLLNFRINFSYRIGKLSQRPSRRVRNVDNNDLKVGESSNPEGNQNRD